MTIQREPGSFRDPCGFVYTRDGDIYRQVQPSYAANYDLLQQSGLAAALMTDGLLVRSTEADISLAAYPGAYRVLSVDRVPFISYPYEWCFSQLKDAALLTLEIQKRAIEKGMSLRDSSAYNVQFVGAKPVFIDTLSFEAYAEGKPWVAYRQFCQHFLAPLALMAHVDIRLSQMLRIWIDGIPLDLAASLLPRKLMLNPGLLTHIFVHGAAGSKYADDSGAKAKRATETRVSKLAMLGLVDSLETTVRKLSWAPGGTEWGNYYANTNYTDTALKSKQQLVQQMLGTIQPAPKLVWDLGANTGLFSRIASTQRINTVAWDIDPAAVEKNYLQCKSTGEGALLPLTADLTNPAPAIGWNHQERKSMLQRGPANVVFALALVHHLAISNNVPLTGVADYLASAGNWLIIEFVPKSDSQVQRLLASREDIFPCYTQDGFEEAFATRFEIKHSAPVPGTERTLYLMCRR